jgi:hypothetical protein
MAPRTTREIETRDQEVRPDDNDWRPPELLPTPEPQEGFVHRWIRMAMHGETDLRNMGMRKQEGWVLVHPEEQPNMVAMADEGSLEKGLIEIGGLVLAKMPAAKAKQRDQYYQNKAVEQIDGLPRQLASDAGADARMPIIQERKSVTNKSPI